MADLDDFFAKKDKKRKTGKKAEETGIKASELFKVLDSAAQNMLADDMDDEMIDRREPQLGPVLSEVLNQEEASKWQEPIEDDERQVDLSNLKIEHFQSPEYDEEEQAKQNAEPVKPAKGWAKPAMKALAAPKEPVEVSVASPPISKESAVVPESEKNPDEMAAGDAKPASETEAHGIMERVMEFVAPMVEKVTEVVASIVAPASVPEPAPAASSTPEPPVKEKYVPPGLRNRAPEPVIAAKTIPVVDVGELQGVYPPKRPKPSDGEAPFMEKTVLKSASGATGGSSGGAYMSPGAKAALAQEQGIKSGVRPGGLTRLNPNKKPELDNEEEFPSLGGGKN